MAGGFWAVFVGFRLHCRYHHRLSKSELSLSLWFIEIRIIVIVMVYRSQNYRYRYRYRYRLSTFSAVVVPKLFEFRYPTLTVYQPFLTSYRASARPVVYESQVSPFGSTIHVYTT